MSRVKLTILVFSIISLIIFPFWIIQFISIFIIFLYSISYILSRIGFSSINIREGQAVYHCKNNSDEYVELAILNSGPILLQNILFKIRGNGVIKNGDDKFVVNLNSHDLIKFKSQIITTTRGVHKIGPIEISGSDLFNFFPWSKTIEIYIDVIIYPKFHDIKLLLSKGDSGGYQKVQNPLYEDLSDLKSIREYRRGDSLKRINWKASAKSGQLQTMEFSSTLSAPLFIFMDLNPIHYPIKNRYTYLERSIEVAASLVASYTQKSEACGLLTQDKSKTLLVPQNRGYLNTVTIMETLANIELGIIEESSIDDFINNKLSLHSGSHIYFILPFIDEGINNILSLIKKSNYTIKFINTGGATNNLFDLNYEVLNLTSYGEEFFS